MIRTSAFMILLMGISTPVFADVIASNNFDTPVNLTTSTSSPVAFNSFASAGDGWGVYDFATGGPFALFDDTVAGSGGNPPFAGDVLGIVQSTKTDSFFGIVDTQNPDVPNGEMTAEFTFDISSALGGLTSIEIDFAGMGDFEAADDLVVSFSIDGNPFTEIFSDTVDEAGSANYTMESGTLVTLDDPISINGTQLTNSFQTVSAGVSGTGSSLVLRVFVDADGGSEALGFDNIVINGSLAVIPEPSTFAAMGLLSGIVFLRRRRRTA